MINISKPKIIKILILGASGMIGNTIFRRLLNDNFLEVYGTVRNKNSIILNTFTNNIFVLSDANNKFELTKVINNLKPDLIINCIGITKHTNPSINTSLYILTNSHFPHMLCEICINSKIRLIHISSDCVFSGLKGNYTEEDFPDANDLYGKSKVLGELNFSNVLTLRCSTIGHEISKSHGLLEWFLSQNSKCFGYRKAIFSGFPTVVLADIIKDFVIPNNYLTGLYHVSSEPINKYELLKIIAKVYQKNINIIVDDQINVNRSLDSTKFRKITNFNPLSWHEMILKMHSFG